MEEGNTSSTYAGSDIIRYLYGIEKIDLYYLIEARFLTLLGEG
nr:MAG TPA: hypothetical protein [Caudoviricetes sp.]